MIRNTSLLFFILSLIVLSCSKEEGEPASELKINGKTVSIDSVAIVYKGDGLAWFYFIEKKSSKDSTDLIVQITDAAYNLIPDGNYRYKSPYLGSKTFTIIGLSDSIISSSLTIKKEEKNYTFNLSLETDSLSISGYGKSSFYIEDYSSYMIIGGVRYEESSSTQASVINADSIQLNIMGSKLSYPQLAVKFPCYHCTELPTGTYHVVDFTNRIQANLFLNKTRTIALKQGEISVEKDSLENYLLQYKFYYNDTLIKGYYNNHITFRQK